MTKKLFYSMLDNNQLGVFSLFLFLQWRKPIFCTLKISTKYTIFKYRALNEYSDS